jgi:hypothetical protein
MQPTAYVPSRYRIVVRGRLGERFRALFDGIDHAAGSGESVLEGSFDQAGLHGVLDKLRCLGIELVSVNRVDGPAPSIHQETPR